MSKSMRSAAAAPPDPRASMAEAMASGASDVLHSARICASLSEALHGTVYALAVSARRRELAYVSADVRSAVQALVAEAQGGEVAIVFGLATIGPAIVQSMNIGDVYVTATFLLVLGATLIIGNIIADLLLVALDPRIRVGANA